VIPPLIINPEAEADLAEAKVWYNGRRPGLGEDFLLCVEEVFEGVRRAPEGHTKVFQELRLALVRRFPYAVVYRADEDQVTVVAVYPPDVIRGGGRAATDPRGRGPGPPRRALFMRRVLSDGWPGSRHRDPGPADRSSPCDR
jgi:toxin ParE1/3/4